MSHKCACEKHVGSNQMNERITAGFCTAVRQNAFKPMPVFLKQATSLGGHAKRGPPKPRVLPAMALSSLSHIRSIRSTCRFATHAIPRGRQPLHPRPYSDGAPQRSAHAQWYADIVPAMIPVALLGSAVYLVCTAFSPWEIWAEMDRFLMVRRACNLRKCICPTRNIWRKLRRKSGDWRTSLRPCDLRGMVALKLLCLGRWTKSLDGGSRSRKIRDEKPHKGQPSRGEYTTMNDLQKRLLSIPAHNEHESHKDILFKNL